MPEGDGVVVLCLPASLPLSSSPPRLRTLSPTSPALHALSNMQAADGPALALEEIMHPMSPSPAPPPAALPPEPQVLVEPQVQLRVAPEHGNDASTLAQVDGLDAAQVHEAQDVARATPEPLDQTDLESMRQRVLELGLLQSSNLNATPLERELASMVRGFLALLHQPLIPTSPSRSYV